MRKYLIISKNDSIWKRFKDLKTDGYNDHIMIFSILNWDKILTFGGGAFTYEFSRS